jgi:signal transduction histidine kinase
MGRLIHDLVDGASIEAGGISLRVAANDAHAVAGEAVEALREVAQERGVALVLRCDAARTVDCDRDRIVQVLCNLVANAVQVTEEGGAVEVTVAAGADGEVTFSVADAGPGIPAEDLPHIFERWYRGRGAQRYPGTGLGLAIAHAFVTAHGGRIWAETREGAGTTFSFALPRDPARAVTVAR